MKMTLLVFGLAGLFGAALLPGCRGGGEMAADLVVLDRDIFEVPPEDIGGARVTMTIMDGRIVYSR